MKLFNRQKSISKTIAAVGAMALALGTISPAVAHENTSDASATAQIPAHEEMNTPMGAGERARLCRVAILNSWQNLP